MADPTSKQRVNALPDTAATDPEVGEPPDVVPDPRELAEVEAWLSEELLRGECGPAFVVALLERVMDEPLREDEIVTKHGDVQTAITQIKQRLAADTEGSRDRSKAWCDPLPVAAHTHADTNPDLWITLGDHRPHYGDATAPTRNTRGPAVSWSIPLRSATSPAQRDILGWAGDWVHVSQTPTGDGLASYTISVDSSAPETAEAGLRVTVRPQVGDACACVLTRNHTACTLERLPADWQLIQLAFAVEPSATEIADPQPTPALPTWATKADDEYESGRGAQVGKKRRPPRQGVHHPALHLADSIRGDAPVHSTTGLPVRPVARDGAGLSIARSDASPPRLQSPAAGDRNEVQRNALQRLFVFCSGANSSILRACPTEELKYAGIGLTILQTAVLTSVLAGFALFSVYRSITAAVAFGILFGMVTFNLDRTIISGMRKQRHFGLELLYATPRVAIAILVAVVIARPLELQLFGIEVDKRLTEMQMDNWQGDVARIVAQNSPRLNELANQNVRLTAEIETRQREFNQAQSAWIAEREGTAGTGIPGAGPVFRERERARLEAARQLDEVKDRNLPLITRNEREIREIRDYQQRRIAIVDSIHSGGNGFLARMEAFDALRDESRTVYWASISIILLFVTLETAPVVLKLLTPSRYRAYDELLEQREFELVELVRHEANVRRYELQAEAERERERIEIESQISTKRSQLRLQNELTASEVLLRQIAEAQMELTARLVLEWKQKEIEKIESGSSARS